MQRVIHVIGQSGHTDTLFRSKADLKAGEKLEINEVDEKTAKQAFDSIMAPAGVPSRRRRAYSLVGTEQVEITKFDPKAEEILIVSQIAGG